MAPRGKKHGGILIRGATGDLWFLRDDWERPRKVPTRTVASRELKKGFEAHARKKGSVESDLPEDILELLNKLFGPLIGAWWVWGSRLAK